LSSIEPNLEAEQPVKLIYSRRAARESAMQAIYCMDTPGVDRTEVLYDAMTRYSFAPELCNLIRAMFEGVMKNRKALDEIIIPLLSADWDYHRISKVDRAILRLATYEIYHDPTMPPKVSINEAVDLAKKFGSPENGRFVNGLLGQLLKDSPKATWVPSAEAPEVTEDEDEAELPVLIEPDPEETIEDGSKEHKTIMRSGAWVLKQED
jgi:N utilization substance protein B